MQGHASTILLIEFPAHPFCRRSSRISSDRILFDGCSAPCSTVNRVATGAFVSRLVILHINAIHFCQLIVPSGSLLIPSFSAPKSVFR